ncbi:hypothetical protein H8E88_09575 [candidate division KSB1 bacterium]|nr:hypothetical protein [candidate division KSB1 bacterium]
MPQTAIKGVSHGGEIIPQEEIPYKEDMNVMIVFLDEIKPGEERYYKPDWIEAEKQATEALAQGRVKTAKSVNTMFDQIEENSNRN